MSILDIFKNSWSASAMAEEDRKKIFWLLKRNTSYTAWKRVADAFDEFAAVVEKQVREEPQAPGFMGGTNWEGSYIQIVEAQVLYEKALIQLKQGDRSVFLYNARGLFVDAVTIASIWHGKVVNGMFGKEDVVLDGKYVPEMHKPLEKWFRADAGYLQSQMAETAAPLVFDPVLYKNVIFPKHLPDVPHPQEEVLVRTDKEVPVFGIYEPQIKDGCMNYLLGGTPAPVYSMLHRQPVTWRLIWQDDRYRDGFIPIEEELYFPAVTPPAATQLPVSDDLLSASTGQPCPKDGQWAVMNDLQGKASLQKGRPMPQHQGRDVTWVWVER
jgi:hypothetical protein